MTFFNPKHPLWVMQSKGWPITTYGHILMKDDWHATPTILQHWFSYSSRPFIHKKRTISWPNPCPLSNEKVLLRDSMIRLLWMVVLTVVWQVSCSPTRYRHIEQIHFQEVKTFFTIVALGCVIKLPTCKQHSTCNQFKGDVVNCDTIEVHSDLLHIFFIF